MCEDFLKSIQCILKCMLQLLPRDTCGCFCCGHTAEQGLVASVCSRQRAQALLTLVQNSAQMACVTQAANGHAMQVHWFHKMAQQCALQAQDVPSEGGEEMEGREERGS